MSINPCDQVGYNFFLPKPKFGTNHFPYAVILSDEKIILHQSTNEGAIFDPRIIGNTTLGLDGSMKTEINRNQYFERVKG